jgi:hypothetical protein
MIGFCSYLPGPGGWLRQPGVYVVTSDGWFDNKG